MQLSRDLSGQWAARVNASESFGAVQLREGIARDGVRLRSEAGTVSVVASRRPVVVEAGKIVAEIPPDSTLNLSAAASVFDFRTLPENAQPVRLRLPDSASADLPPDSQARAEFMEDGTYALTGRTNLLATTADGQAFKFSRHSGPMLGGNLVEHFDARGVRRLSRASPAVLVDLAGSPDGEVRVTSQSLTLIPGQERLLTFPNGARVFLRHDPARSSVEWRVAQGVCHLSVAGFTCWKAAALSGQAGTLQWNPEKRIVDLNLSAESPGFVAVQLSGRVSASVSAGATFQYAQFQDCGSFAASGLGDAMLHDRETGEALPLQAGVIAYNEGARAGETAVGRPFNPVTLGWDTGARVELRGGVTTYRINAGTELTAEFGEDRLTAAYRPDGSVLIRSLEGNFNLRGAFLPNVTFDIPEGGAIVLRLNRARMVFSAEAAQDTGAELRVISGGQTYMYLSGGARVTVVLGQNSILPEGNTSWIFFEGAGGEETFLSGQQPGQIVTPDRIDADRIVQPPVTVLE